MEHLHCTFVQTQALRHASLLSQCDTSFLNYRHHSASIVASSSVTCGEIIAYAFGATLSDKIVLRKLKFGSV